MINNIDRNKVYINTKNKLEKIENSLSEMSIQIFNSNSNVKLLKEAIKYDLNTISKSIEELKRPFLLFIIGPGKYGKTTLINSLIKEKLLDTNDIPNTWKVDVLIKSENEKLEIIYKNSKDITLELDEGISLINKEEIKSKESKIIIKNEFNKYKNLGKKTTDELKVYKKYLEEKYLYKSDIEEVRYYMNKSGILDDFIIIDTPGLNQTLKSDTIKRMANYYNRADGVIWILDAQNIIAKSSEDLVSELKKDYIIDDEFNNIICVVNKIDLIKKEDREKIDIKVKQLYKNKFKDIILISSKQSIDGYINKDINSIESSNINGLLNSIENNFTIYSKKVQLKAKYNVISVSSCKIEKSIKRYKRQIYMDIHRYEESKFGSDKKLENAEIELNMKITKTISNINLSKENIINEIVDLENYINTFIKNLYFSILDINSIDSSYYKSIIDNKILSINFSKSKYVFKVLKAISDSKENSRYNNNKINIYNKLLNYKDDDIDLILKNEIDVLNRYIIDVVNKKLLEIKFDIDYFRSDNFRNKYTDYDIIQNHLKTLNDISINIKNWEDIYGEYI